MVSGITLIALVAMASVATAIPTLCRCPIMPIMAHPVCASNGETFLDVCHLNCYRENSGENIVKVHDGPCDSKFLVENKAKLEPTKNEMCICTMEFSPVCGSNLHTYSNQCMLGCDAKKNPSLKVLYRGRCIIMP